MIRFIRSLFHRTAFPTVLDRSGTPVRLGRKVLALSLAEARR